MLVDWPAEGKKFWLADELRRKGFNVILEGIENFNSKNTEVKWRKLILWGQYFALGWRGAKKAKHHNGVILSWSFIPGIFAAIILKFFFMKDLKVIALNMIARKKGIIIETIRDYIYKLAFKKTDIFITVNSKEMREKYINKYDIHQDKIAILQDPYSIPTSILKPNYSDYVFSGGEAARDWDTVIKVAQKCPDIPFVVIARRKYWDHSKEIPVNLKVYFDTSEEEFYGKVANSRLVILPLNSDVTAGLIVLKASILMGKAVITTETPATINYYPPECRSLLLPMGDAERLSSVLQQLWHNDEERLIKANLLQEYIRQHFSPASFASRVADLLTKQIPKF